MNDYYNNETYPLTFGGVALHSDIEGKFDEVKAGFDLIPDADYFEALPDADELADMQTALAALAAGSGVVVSSEDTTAGYLEGKILNADGSAFVIGSAGGNETLTVPIAPTYLAKTADYTVTAANLVRNSVFTNTGAAGEVILSLPAGAAGMVISAVVTVAQYLRVKASGTEKLRFRDTQSAAGGYARANVIGNTLHAEWSGTEWSIRELVGEWSFDGSARVGTNQLLPDQTSNTGKYLATNGTVTSWDAPLPSQTTNTGKYLTTNGTAASWDAPLPAQTSKSGYTLQTNGTAASWTNIPRSGFISPVAHGAITAGDVVVLNSDGTVSAANAGTVSSGTAVAFESGTPKSLPSSCYDSVNGVVVFAFVDDEDSDKGKAVVGTIDGEGVISFGTTVEFEAGATHSVRCCYDSTNGKVVICFVDDADFDHGKAIVGTVSGTDISFGAVAAFAAEAVVADSIACAFDAAAGKVAIFHTIATDGHCKVGTVSGTDITFGAEATLKAAAVTLPWACYDPDYEKIVVVFHSTNPSISIGSIVGTDISFQGETTLTTADSSVPIGCVYDTVNDKVAAGVNVNGTLRMYAVTVVAGTGFSVGPAVALADSTAVTTLGFSSICFNPTSACVAWFFRLSTTTFLAVFTAEFVTDRYVFGTVSTLHSAASDNITCTNAGTRTVVGFEATNCKAIVYDFTTTTYGWVGIATETVATGNAVVVTTIGGVNSNQTGLTPGATYYVDIEGDLSISSDVAGEIGRALSATSILVTKGGFE